ncbi:hypothetical protein [Yinghuangia soli]|uniref:Uncharacterized protein n=1 Tax=Yinghuangia soli TaxID=2908204 RepID=A0AA41Q070_9ACTN|nr:hypothetical protein [Yinghuangia soli]MCF2529148.1 hypothetical protein [Yinghuangia soli]
MTTAALDLREHHRLDDDLDSGDDHAGPTAPGRTLRLAPEAAPARPAPAPARLRCADCGTVLTPDHGRDADEHDPEGAAEHAAPAGPAELPEHAGPHEHGDASDAPVGVRLSVPVHAVLPEATAPFAVRVCPGSGRPSDPEADAVPVAEPEAPAPPALTLPPGLHWRTRPFSHAGS